MIKPEGNAPYAPTPAVMGVIDAYRNKPVPIPITVDVVKRIGISDSMAHRTVQALKLLDLLDDDGNPTAAFQDIRKVAEDDFRPRLAEVVRAAYADILAYRDPASDDGAKIADAFREYLPHSMRTQMARLFLGLCEESGIITTKPAVVSKLGTRKPKIAKTFPKPVTVPVATAEEHSEAKEIIASTGPFALAKPVGYVAGADHLAIRGLLQTLPPVGSVFPEGKRREWADAMLATFALIYEREPQKSQKGGGSG